MLRKILKGLGALVGLLVVAVAGLIGYVNYKFGKTYDIPLPNIQRATSPEALARGKMIFRSVCIECHMPAGETRVIGAPMRDLPEALGSIHTANITRDPEGGVGKMTDEQIARMIIYAVDRNGKRKPMMTFRGMSDDDIAAVIGYMRSDAPEFEAYPKKAPPTEAKLPGKFVSVFVFAFDENPRPFPFKGPERAPTAEYGKYLASDVLDCLFCHTPGLKPVHVKAKSPDAWAGGWEVDLRPAGFEGFLYSANITPHETQGIGKWTLEQFKTAMRGGINPDGYILRRPMPKFRNLEDVELEAMFAFLKSLPPKESPKQEHPMVPRPKVDPTLTKPEQLFSSLGCTYCHGPKGKFRDKLKESLNKQPEEVAKWIRNPESFKPGTQMPTFAELINEGQALELAKWVQEKKGEP